MLLCSVTDIFVTCSARTRNITTRLARTYRCTRMHRSRAPCRSSVARWQCRFWADCTTNISEHEFPTGTTGENSPFVLALIKHIETPGLEVNFLFRKVRDDVLAATERHQEPFVYGSLPAEPFYFLNPDGEGKPVRQVKEAARAASTLLDARRKAVDDIQAGRAAPYYFARATAPSQQPRSRPFATSGGQKGLQ
jgi:hypothetical protein